MSEGEVSVTKEQFHDFQRLQKGGLYNMVHPDVRDILCISKEQHYYMMEHYDELEKEFGGIL